MKATSAVTAAAAAALAAYLLRSEPRSSRPATDDVLVARVKTKLGRFLAHPRAVQASASGGIVTLQGHVLEDEAERALAAVRAVPGVRDLVDRLERHATGEGVSSLQGGMLRAQRPDILQDRWAPATRFLVGAAGGGLLLRGLGRPSLTSIPLALAGGAMLLRAGANMPLQRIIEEGGRAIELTNSLVVAAPVEQVFEFWDNFENFPTFMRNVRSITKNPDDTWRWEVAGPLGTTATWDATVTVRKPNELIAWTTTPGSEVENAGLVHFQREGGGTRIQVDLSYKPPGAALGHAVAALLGADPMTEMDQDLARMKELLEGGRLVRPAGIKEPRAQPPAALPPG